MRIKANAWLHSMRPLFGREYSQARLFIFAVPIVHFLTLGLQRMNRWSWSVDTPQMVKVSVHNGHSVYSYIYNYGIHEVAGRFWLLLAAFVLALVQLGVERRNGSQELLFSLPYARGRIFLAKWLLGAALFGGSLLLNTLIDAVVVAASPASHYWRLDYFAVQFGYSLLVVLAGYSFALLIGAFTGSVASQTILTWALVAFPIVFIELLDFSLQAHGIYMSRQGGSESYSPLMWGDLLRAWLNFFSYTSVRYEAITWSQALSLLVITIGSFVGSLFAYKRNPTENNGKLMLFKSGESVLRWGFILCASMLAGTLGMTWFGLRAGDRVGYDIGFVLGCVLSIWIIRALLRMRFKY